MNARIFTGVNRFSTSSGVRRSFIAHFSGLSGAEARDYRKGRSGWVTRGAGFLAAALALGASLLSTAPLSAQTALDPKQDMAAVAAPPKLEPYERCAFDFESSALWSVGDQTTLDYVLLPQVFSVRTPYVMKWDLKNQAAFVVRSNLAFLGEIVAEGPESYYLGFHASPSFEYWTPSRDTHLYFAIGGGCGWVDSQDVEGAQGQDFTFNWFAKTGLRFNLTEDFSCTAGVFFQHMSNQGMTDPNPGLNAVGPTIGFSWKF